jgi:NADH:ubiquinone oxidoreductase subunit E
MNKTYTETELDQVIQRLVQHHGARRAEVIPILSELNETFGHIPVEALGKIRRAINTPEEGLFLADSHLYATASFYSMFSLKPVGKHVIRFCESAPCHVVGAREVVEAIQDHLGIKVGETTADNEWTLLTTSCIGLCSVAPVIMIDDQLYGNLTPERIPEILAKVQGGEA